MCSIDDRLQIDLLIGSDFYWSMVTGVIRRGKSGPTAIQTKVGWVLSGPTDVREVTTNLTFTSTHLLNVHCIPAEDKLEDRLKKFWDLETLGIQTQEQSVGDSFTQQIKFTEGRYQVRLPWKPTHRPLPDNLELCEKRLAGLLKKLKTTPQLLVEYDKVIKDQLEKGVVEIAPAQESLNHDKVHYLPHHGVVRKDRATTKIRVVYDASARNRDHPSLNDCLYTGPTFGQSIFDILLRFRRHPVALAADIEKAFLMVSMAPEDRDALRFLWSPDIQEDPPQIVPLRFTRVAFGVNCSPFLLNATIDHHIKSYWHEDPEFVDAFLSSIYVDDLSFGAQDEHLAYQLYIKAKTRLAEAGFNLRKFVSNSSTLQRLIDANEETQISSRSNPIAEEDESFAKTSLDVKVENERRDGEQRILGVRWDRGEDKLVFGLEGITEHLRDMTPTKRDVVGMAARIFDPLGVLAPATILCKMFFQTLSKAELEWDEPLSGNLLAEWEKLYLALSEPVTITIPRAYQLGVAERARLVGFCDASSKAYAAVAYLRIGDEHTAQVEFLASKTRVAPTKAMTIPRLELLSALLLAKLCHSIEMALKPVLQLEETICYTDSKVSLYWIAGVDQEWKQFVENRVTNIRQLVPSQNWKHCPGKQNPADIPSRGMSPRDLESNKIWLNGPEWLAHQLKPATEVHGEAPKECLLEKKKQTHTLATSQVARKGLGQLIKPERFSCLKKLLRVTALVIKFVRTNKETTRESTMDLEQARILWLREAQVKLQSDKRFKLWQRQLDLSLDENQLWRCGGRLSKSELDPAARAPIVLDREHHITKLLVQEAHNRVLHDGLKETLTELRTTYWVIRGRQLVKQLIHRCPVCRRHEGRAYQGLPAPALPAFRVQHSRPFSSTGVDFAGPLYVKEQENPKTWMCLYTCCTTRAVHLDLVQDLNTLTFLRSFKRFCARRGIPTRMLSDNAKTFKAADKAIQAIFLDPTVQQHFAGMRVEWQFNLEKAPWWGGIFERMVKSAKRCLKKVIGKQLLTYDELLTLVIEVEAVLNSRPLSYISTEDLEEPLTPSHLMTAWSQNTFLT